MHINWDSFTVYNQDSHGVRYKFEDLCRQLFVNEFISPNKQFRYLHSNPNNAGLESEPLYDEVNKRRIGFQAKYFDDRVSYNQIEQSAQKIKSTYSGKVDLVYLFCNKPLTTDSLKRTINILQSVNISLQLITDNAILDLVRNKYPYLGLYYFGNHMLSPEWFRTHTTVMADELGERYNRDFNVHTTYSYELSLFLHDQTAAEYLNEKKARLLSEIEKIYLKHEKNRDYLNELKEAVLSLYDVDTETLYDSITWVDTVSTRVNPYLDKYVENSKCIEKKLDDAYARSYNNTQSKESREAARKEYLEMEQLLRNINDLLRLPHMIEISVREQQLLRNKVMNLSGRAGTGKSQLLAYKTNSLLDENRTVLLLLAGIYFADTPIQEQIMSNLRLNYSFEELIDVLETIGERDNCIVPIFIDALNETWNKKLWKTGLPQIVEKIKQASMVKLVFSCRPEYNQMILSESIEQEIASDEIVKMMHRGFEENSGIAIREFLNHYSIPFTPFEFFGTEMSNPLFLTLYCKTYNGEEVSLPTLYERLIERIGSNIFDALSLHSKGFSEDDDILSPLVSQISAHMIANDCRAISNVALMKLKYWTEYGLAPVPFIRLLVKEGLLHDYAFESVEYFYFAYDQMNDYYCAKAIMDTHADKTAIRDCLAKQILKIENGELGNSRDIDLFVNCCVLYAERYGEECIDIIDSITEKREQWEVFSRFIRSFQWRDSNYISSKLLNELLQKYPCRPEDLWPMLIGNSIKVHHPLNANFLHNFLSNYEINKRDYLWTIYINKLPLDEDNRIVQLVQLYDRGERLDNTSEEQLELILTLLGWILTSSNRWLRDYTSKAMIEILKEHFTLCLPVLKKFKNVNDPYVLQRVYGIIFGASCKRTTGNLQTVAEYVFETVFHQDKVYPDVLLRDYARLIIERFLWETPKYIGVIDHLKIIPPYTSDPIPEIEDQHYDTNEYDGAVLRLVMSMRIENMGGYGDFGRYVFQSALHSFNVDDKKMFNFAVYNILNNIGFSEEYFGEYDCHCNSYDRHLTAKTERIGKKYQWITMYNMLARIADNCKMVDLWDYPKEKEVQFEGAWDPYVRDFDPTLNKSFMIYNDAPSFAAIEEHKANGIAENQTVVNTSDPNIQKKWLEEYGVFFKELKDTLLLTDDSGVQWVCLTKYCDTGHRDLNKKRLLVWSWLYAYFVTPEQSVELSNCFEKGVSIVTSQIASHHETYTAFNREYPWSPSCHKFKEYAWVDVRIPTGEVEIVNETIQVPDMSSFNLLLKKYNLYDEEASLNESKLCFIETEYSQAIKEYNSERNTSANTEDNTVSELEIQYKTITKERRIEKEIGKILHATSELLWEEEYDATKEDAISQSFPCAKLIEVMGLRQLVADGFLFDSEGKLAAFDTNRTQQCNSVVVRKDILDSFLAKTGMKLIWIVDAEKEIHAEDYTISNWSNWEALFEYEGNGIIGELHKLSS